MVCHLITLALFENRRPVFHTNYYLGNDGKPHRGKSEYDYDGLFEERDGEFYVSYCLLEFTATTHFVFGVCWIFDCDDDRETQTRFGADPTMMGSAINGSEE